MTKRQFQKVGAEDSGEDYLDTPANKVKVDAYVPLNRKVTRYKAKLALLHLELEKQGVVITGLRKQKDQKRLMMANKVMPIVKAGLDWAIEERNQDVVDKLDFDKNKLLKPDEEESVATGRNALNTVTGNLTAINEAGYEVSGDDIEAAQTLINEFDGMLEKPKAALNLKKEATGKIVELQTELDELTDGIRRNIESKYGESDPEFLSGFDLAVKVGDVPYHITGIRVIVKRGEEMLEGIVVKVREQDKGAVTNIDGVAKIERLKVAKNHMDVVENGNLVKTLVVDIKRGTMLEVGVEL